MSSVCNDVLTALFREHYRGVQVNNATFKYRYFSVTDNIEGHLLYSVSINDGKLFIYLGGYNLIDIIFDMSDPKFDIEEMRIRLIKLSEYFSNREKLIFPKESMKALDGDIRRILGI